MGTVLFSSLPRLAVVAGPAGIGKTRFLLENFTRLIHETKDPFARDLLYILPSAEHRERIIDLMLRKEGTGFFGERVTTFNRLMQEFLKAGDFYLATDAERRFLLNEILSEKGGGYFSAVRGFPGFLEKLSDFLGELKESMMSLKVFEGGMRALKKKRPEIAEKYDELLQIYNAYEAKLEALGLKDHRDGLFLLREMAELKKLKAPLFRHLFVDGFFDFSKSQLEFLGWLAERSERILLTLSADLSSERKGLFEIPLETLRDLKKMGFQIVKGPRSARPPARGMEPRAGTAPDTPDKSGASSAVDLSRQANCRASSEVLRHLEKNLWSEKPEMKQGKIEPSPLLIMEATGIRGEAEMIAREIRRLVRTERLHFSDIAVILRRIGEYEGILRTVFRQFDIPVEIHERERLREAPLARTLANFFKVLLNDWKREDLFNFLKSSYLNADYDEVCHLEIQGLDHGILSGRERWLKEMSCPLFEKLNAFQDRFSGGHSVEEYLRLAQEVIESFGLSRIPEAYETKSRRDFATLKRIQNLLEEIRRSSVTWENSKRTFESFAKEFLGLIEVDLFSLHERDKNLVQVYDVSLARQKEYKVVFLAGLLEKYFPAEIREDPILSDEERHAVGLKERLPRQALERYLFYLGLTRAREKVILSYPRFDLEGQEALPSFYVDEVQRLFETPLPKRSYPVSQALPRLEDTVDEREVEAHAVKRLWQKVPAGGPSENQFTLGLYNRLLERESFRNLLPRILFEPVAQIRDESVRAAFLPKGGIFKPTGLEIYGRCPYRYFASQVLQLEEKEEGIDARQVGTLLHDVLEHYWRERVEKGKEELGNVDEAKAFVKERLQALLKEAPLTGERAYRIEVKKAQMEEWLCRMVEKEIEEGHPLPPFRPRYFEFEFGFKPKEVGHLRLYDPYREDLLLRGKIDRVDVDPSGNYALVIDYKTGGTFRRQDLEFGTALQLPLYLLAVQQHLKLKPLGGEIYQVSTAENKGFYAKPALEGTGAAPKSRAVFDQKDFDKILERAVGFSFQFAEGIKQAKIPVRPRDCDKYCPYSAVCRIEKWRLPFIYQEIREEDKQKTAHSPILNSSLELGIQG